MGQILILQIPPQNLRQLKISGKIRLSPYARALSPFMSRHDARPNPSAPSQPCSIVNSTAHPTLQTPSQASYSPRPVTFQGMTEPSLLHSSAPTSHTSTRNSEELAGVFDNTWNPFAKFARINQPERSIEHTMSDLQQPTVSKNVRDAYLDYSPGQWSSGDNYCNFLSRLGFRQEHCDQAKNHPLIRDLKAYLDGIDYFFLRRFDNENAFKSLVLNFLREYGLKYWGPSERNNLAEQDPSKGFLYPRDVERGGSRLLDVMESLFDYKASSNYTADRRKPEIQRVHPYINFAAMTGQRKDAKRLRDIGPRAGTDPNASQWAIGGSGDSKGTSSQDMRSQKRKAVMSDSDNDGDHAWNVFDVVETQTRLRPNPSPIKWTRELPRENKASDSHTKRHHRSVRSIKGKSQENDKIDRENPQKKRQRRLSTAHSHRASTPTSGESDVPLKATRKHRPTPSTSRTQSEANVRTVSLVPDRVPPSTFISLVSDEESPTKVKAEPLSAGARAGTVLKVSMHTQPEKVEISVPLGACRTSDELFTKLTTEWRLRPEMAKKVNFISARYRWSGEPHGMRRGVSRDFELFCGTVRDAWDMKEENNTGKLVVDMKLIADE